MQKLSEWIVTCGGLGYLPKAPGTWASAAAALFGYFWLLKASSISLLVVAMIILIISPYFIRLFESTKQSHDASEIVIDEWVGMSIALFGGYPDPLYVLVAFGLFRFFDIFKPLGIKYFDQRYFRGWGVMLDDVLAGIYAALILGVFRWFAL